MEIAFDQLIQQEHRKLNQFALHLTQNTEDAGDLLQDTLLKAYQYRQKFEDGSNLKAWLFTIMRNTFINNYRSAKRKRETFQITECDISEMQLGRSERNAGEQQLVLRELNHAIAELPEGIRKAFSLNLHGFKYHEIAQILSIPIGTVKTRIFMAKRMLRQSLHAYAS